MRRVVIGVLVAALVAIVVAGGLSMGLGPNPGPTMPQVVKATQGAMPLSATAATAMTIDGVGFPDWSRWGWRATGGRTDTYGSALLGRRATGTVVYRKGDRTIAYTVAEGTEDVNSDQMVRAVYRTPPTGKTELVLGGDTGGISFADLPLAGNYACDDPALCSNLGAHLTVKRKIRGRTVALVGLPVTERHLDEMQDMALRIAR